VHPQKIVLKNTLFYLRCSLIEPLLLVNAARVMKTVKMTVEVAEELADGQLPLRISQAFKLMIFGEVAVS